jgi:hypothetical protein
VTPLVVNTGGSNTDSIEHPQQARPRLTTGTPLVVNTGGSDTGVTDKPSQTKRLVAGRKRARDYFDGDELSEEVARVTTTARTSQAPRSVLHQAPPPPVDAHQGEELPVTSRIIHKIQRDAPKIYYNILAKLDCHSNNTQNNTSAHTNSISSLNSEQDNIILNNNSNHNKNNTITDTIDNNNISLNMTSVIPLIHKGKMIMN